MPIIIDQREPKAYQKEGDVVRYIPNGWGDAWLVTEVPDEDDMVYPEKLREAGILVRAYERKKLNDLYYSRLSGRLNKQLVDSDVLIVEITQNIRRGVRDDSLISTINNVSEHTITKFVVGPETFGKLLRADEARHRRGEPFGLNRVQVVDNTSSDRRVRVLHALGVGPKTARKVIRKYGTLENAISHLDEWDSIKGIGPHTVKKARGVLESRKVTK